MHWDASAKAMNVHKFINASRIRNAHGRLGKSHPAEIHQWHRAELSNALSRLRNALSRLRNALGTS
jgi:hypothetical protein